MAMGYTDHGKVHLELEKRELTRNSKNVRIRYSIDYRCILSLRPCM